MNHDVTLQTKGEKRYVASELSNQFIRTPQDVLDLIVWGGERGATLFLLEDLNFSLAFYDLKTGLAGEILQKLSNYGVRLAIVGQFALVKSKRFRELMSESNKGSQVRFARSRDEAIAWMMQLPDAPHHITRGTTSIENPSTT